MQVLPLQSIPNVIAAVAGGQADGAITAATRVLAPIERGEFRLMGFIGDETSWQLGTVFTSTKTDTRRRDMIDRFLRAFRNGVRDYHDAFAGGDDKRRHGATAAEMLDQRVVVALVEAVTRKGGRHRGSGPDKGRE
jgi:NitT/TauT family transport system substrate-binding protein